MGRRRDSGGGHGCHRRLAPLDPADFLLPPDLPPLEDLGGGVGRFWGEDPPRDLGVIFGADLTGAEDPDFPLRIAPPVLPEPASPVDLRYESLAPDPADDPVPRQIREPCLLGCTGCTRVLRRLESPVLDQVRDFTVGSPESLPFGKGFNLTDELLSEPPGATVDLRPVTERSRSPGGSLKPALDLTASGREITAGALCCLSRFR